MKHPRNIARWALSFVGTAVLIGAAFAEPPGSGAVTKTKVPKLQSPPPDARTDPVKVPVPPPPRPRQTKRPCKTAKPARVVGKLNINTATRAELLLLPGIGPSKAERILSYRARRPFHRIKDLRRVKGFGRKSVLGLKRYLIITGESTLRAESLEQRN